MTLGIASLVKALQNHGLVRGVLGVHGPTSPARAPVCEPSFRHPFRIGVALTGPG